MSTFVRTLHGHLLFFSRGDKMFEIESIAGAFRFSTRALVHR